MTISMDKQYRTRCGYEVRIYATDHFGYYPIVGAILCGKNWVPVNWRLDGVSSPTDNSLDLIEVKPRIQREYWVNIPPEENISPVCWLTKEKADGVSSDDRLACVKITIDCQEGDGL
jgi:hypothetical protein